MNKADKFVAVLEEFTPLEKDKDLFYLEIPLGKYGIWFADRQTDSRFNDTGIKEFDIYYRAKSKESALANINYFKDTIDNLDDCRLSDGEDFKVRILFNWEFIEKDSEGYFVFANTVSVL